jgi:hypothetical protein
MRWKFDPVTLTFDLWPCKSIRFQILLRTRMWWTDGRTEGRKDGRTEGRTDGSVTISLRNFVGEGINKCLCLLFKYGIKSKQLPWSKRHWTNQIWGELFTSTMKFPSNDQRVMSRGYRSVLSRGLTTIYKLGFLSILYQTIHSVWYFCCSCWYKFRDRSSSRFKKCLARLVQNVY